MRLGGSLGRAESLWRATTIAAEPSVRPSERSTTILPRRRAAPTTARRARQIAAQSAPLAARSTRRPVLLGAALGVWGVIGGGALLVYYGSQLPPIDQLAVPKRPPNIAILARGRRAARQSRRHRRRGGAASPSCRPICPRPSSPSRTAASIRIGASIRMGIGRALLRNVAGTRRHAGRLDADPAARQESVPDAGAHDLAQDPGGDPRALARAQISPRTRFSNSISTASISAPAPMASRRRRSAISAMARRR